MEIFTILTGVGVGRRMQEGTKRNTGMQGVNKVGPSTQKGKRNKFMLRFYWLTTASYVCLPRERVLL